MWTDCTCMSLNVSSVCYVYVPMYISPELKAYLRTRGPPCAGIDPNQAEGHPDIDPSTSSSFGMIGRTIDGKNMCCIPIVTSVSRTDICMYVYIDVRTNVCMYVRVYGMFSALDTRLRDAATTGVLSLVGLDLQDHALQVCKT